MKNDGGEEREGGRKRERELALCKCVWGWGLGLVMPPMHAHTRAFEAPHPKGGGELDLKKEGGE